MPSSKNPVTVVLPGPGKLPAGTVTASALLFPPGGGSGAALAAHITDPVDAHMASAIGVNPLNPAGLPILSSAGGVVDGESVLDFIDAAKDLFPVRPNYVGLDATPNSGVPDWFTLGPNGTGTGLAVTGGFTRGTDVIYTHCVVPDPVFNVRVEGMVYPADRGVLALYSTADGDYTTGTLVAALSLGDAAIAGIPSASFVEALRPVQQVDHPVGGGLDLFGLMARTPYLRSYAGYAVPWLSYSSDFLRYQLGYYGYTGPAPVLGDAGSWLLVHWKESYATSAPAIAPSVLGTQLTAANCYSAVTPDLDTDPLRKNNRHNVFIQVTVADPASVLITSAVNAGAVPTKVWQSGVEFYDGTGLNLDITLQASGLFDGSFYTGTSNDLNGPPAGFESQYNPLALWLASFGMTPQPYRFSQLHAVGSLIDYSTSNPPAAADVAELVLTNYPLPVAATPYTHPSGRSTVGMLLKKPCKPGDFTFTGAPEYLFNSYPQTGATWSDDTWEDFADEKYRYNDIALVTPLLPLEPVGGDAFDPTVVFLADDGKLQTIGSRIVYPQENFSFCLPAGPDYSALGDTPNHHRVYVRAFDTGVARNTGRIRLVGQFNFECAPEFHGDDTDHPNGAIVEICVPGLTGWLDLGRDKGSPDLATTDGRGCRTGVTTNGLEVIVSYDTTEYTAPNGIANGNKYLIFVRVTFINAGVGTTYYVDEMEWLEP